MYRNPFIPNDRASIAIIDGRASQEIKDNLDKFGIKTIDTCKCEELYDSISYHPDIVIHPISYNKVIVAPNVYDYYNDILPFYGIKVIRGERNSVETILKTLHIM